MWSGVADAQKRPRPVFGQRPGGEFPETELGLWSTKAWLEVPKSGSEGGTSMGISHVYTRGK